MSYKGAIMTGRGGVGNARAGPATLGQSVIETHPQTVAILAQHEANIVAYERSVIARHKEAKANRPRVSGRGGLGNIAEADPRSAKPLRRASLFKGGGAAITSLSSPKDRVDMNAYDEQERLDYARGLKGLDCMFRTGSTITVNTLSPSRPSFILSSDTISEACSSEDSNLSHSESGSIAPSTTTFRPQGKRSLTAVWRKMSFSRYRHSSLASDNQNIHMDLLDRAARATQSMSHLPPTQFDNSPSSPTEFGYLPRSPAKTIDISRDALYFNPANKTHRKRGNGFNGYF